MKKQVLFILFPLLTFGQVQIGGNIDGEAANDWSGTSVSLSGDGLRLAVGAEGNSGNGYWSGHVRIYEYSSGDWVQLGSDIDGEAEGDLAGVVNLSDDGSIVAVGAYSNDGINGEDSGHVRIFEYSGGDWVQMGDDIDGEAADDYSGVKLSLSSDGMRVVIGAYYNSEIFYAAGHARIFEFDGSNWVQLGSDIDGEAEYDWLGSSVSISGDGNRVAVGAIFSSGNGVGEGAGQARIFEYDGSDWIQLGSDIDGEAAGDLFGASTSFSDDGSIVAIGGYNNGDGGYWAGHVRIYEYNGSSWEQMGDDIDGKATQERFGYSISLSSDGLRAVIGAPNSSVNGIGHVRIYDYDGVSWIQKGGDIDGEEASDFWGSGLSLSNDGLDVAIGAPYKNTANGIDSGQVRVYDPSAILSSDDFVLSHFDLFPNPAKHEFNIRLKESLQLENVNIYNQFGQLLISTKSIIVDTNSLSSGLYYVEIETDLGKATKKLVVK